MAKPELFPTPKTFAELVTAVRAALIAGQARADRVYLESYHTTGFLIDAHILFLKRARVTANRSSPNSPTPSTPATVCFTGA
jgi:hypothetical protein